MIKQPEKGTRNVTDLFYEAERKRIEMLNNAFFHDVELTEVDSLEDAEAYIENCNPIDEVKWSDFVEAGHGEEVEG
ncbi:hypothetical protein ACTM97_06340 [Oliverpabstia intestinalis]|uniref:hypothetical protein n=1 Tax=Oliverpabstia intestinalis TaxID=2606633 RepID=UPI003F8CDB37